MSKTNRKQNAREITGWLSLDKPYGMSSSQAVAKVKYLFNAKKAGHAGTLDPLATGMLPIALGEATKTVAYIMEGTKHYSFQISWGEERSTDDLEGETLRSSQARPQKNAIFSLLPQYIGKITQTPPQFSAIKCEGKRAYDLAREGQQIELKTRQIIIEELQLLAHAPDNSYSNFSISCGKGTYIRSLARDMGRALGCFGYISQLRRTKVEPFAEAQLVDLASLTELHNSNSLAIDKYLINSAELLVNYSQYNINTAQALEVKQGRHLTLTEAKLNEAVACLIYQNQLIAIGAIQQQVFYPKRVCKS